MRFIRNFRRISHDRINSMSKLMRRIYDGFTVGAFEFFRFHGILYRKVRQGAGFVMDIISERTGSLIGQVKNGMLKEVV